MSDPLMNLPSCPTFWWSNRFGDWTIHQEIYGHDTNRGFAWGSDSTGQHAVFSWHPRDESSFRTHGPFTTLEDVLACMAKIEAPRDLRESVEMRMDQAEPPILLVKQTGPSEWEASVNTQPYCVWMGETRAKAIEALAEGMSRIAETRFRKFRRLEAKLRTYEGES